MTTYSLFHLLLHTPAIEFQITNGLFIIGTTSFLPSLASAQLTLPKPNPTSTALVLPCRDPFLVDCLSNARATLLRPILQDRTGPGTRVHRGQWRRLHNSPSL